LPLPREAHARFQALIARLSARLGTPAFEPHVTLLGSVAEHVLREAPVDVLAVPPPARVFELP
jgi:nucleotide-binding universal stress UspA family protein